MFELKPIPGTEKIEWKERFVEKYSKLTDFDEFKRYSLSFLRKSIRVNTLKTSVADIKKRLGADWELLQVPWCKEGFWIEHKGIGEEKRRDVGNLLEHSLGYIYVQEAASMIPPLALDPQPGETVLDLCAAPGSKTTQIAQLMENKGVLIANESSGKRIAALGINVQRCGIRNCIITNSEGHHFFKKGIEFDRILIDAPCSGTGTIRKSLKTIGMWNPNMVKRICGTQRQLIKTAFEILKPGGTMVYSTCTLEPEEDELVVQNLLDNYDNAEIAEIKLKGLEKTKGNALTSYDGKELDKNMRYCLRIWPQDYDTEGFFVSKIYKKKSS